MKKSLELCGLQGLIYFLGCISIRAAADSNYLWTGGMDALLLILGFSVFKRLHDARTLADRVCYVVGGVTGSQIAIYLTIRIFGH